MASLSLDDIKQAARLHHLAVFGAFHPTAADKIDAGTLILFGPHEPGFWPHFTASPEYMGAQPDPMDRWSTRVISQLATQFKGSAHFPFGGPPYEPFFTWAVSSGEAWSSPVHLLVQVKAGLMVSYRGAIALHDTLELPPPPEKPCDSCSQPCLTACPSGALTTQGYDVPKCHSYLDTDAGAAHLSLGCNVRRSCPLSESYGRLAEQSAYHMSLFHK